MAENSKSAAKAEAPAEPISVDSFAQMDREKFAQNMLRVGVQTQHLIADFLTRAANQEKQGPLDPLNIGGAILTLAKAMGSDRQTVVGAQLQLWRDWMGLWETTALRILGG